MGIVNKSSIKIVYIIYAYRTRHVIIVHLHGHFMHLSSGMQLIIHVSIHAVHIHSTLLLCFILCTKFTW